VCKIISYFSIVFEQLEKIFLATFLARPVHLHVYNTKS